MISPAELFTWVDTPLDGRVPLWREIPAGTFRMGSPEEDGYNAPSREAFWDRGYRVVLAPPPTPIR